MNSAATFPLTPLLESIARQAQAGGPWSLSSAEVRDLLGVSSAEYYRRIAAAEASGDTLVGLGAATGSFAQENVGELLAVLELFCGAETESRLHRAGVFFPHSEQAEILQEFHGLSARAIRDHRLCAEEYSDMLRAFGRWERAVSVYLGEHLPVEALVEAAAERYCAARSFDLPALARANVAGLLGYFFQKHVLDPAALFEPIRAALFAQAVREGYAEAPRPAADEASHDDARDAARSSEAQRTLSACRVLEIEPAALGLPLLKGRYKRLMKRFHPDLNPQGLRRCQEINAAYALLLSHLEAG